MASNTHSSDINEIMLTYYLSNKNWKVVHEKRYVKEILKNRKKDVDSYTIKMKTEQAKEQAKCIMSWCRKNGYKAKIKQVYWTGRQGLLSESIGQYVSKRKNPTDVLLEFCDGQFLGISSKSTFGKDEVPFKNLGLGTIDKILNTDFKNSANKKEDVIISELNLPRCKKNRKEFLRKNKSVKQTTSKLGKQVLTNIRNEVYRKIKKMLKNDLEKHILKTWLDSRENSFPKYIKVTAMGSEKPFNIKIEDPIKNTRTDNIRNAKNINAEKVGDMSIGILADDERVLKIRVKYESEKIASSLKFSGDPWK